LILRGVFRGRAQHVVLTHQAIIHHWSLPCPHHWGKKTALFEPFIYKMHYFTKTGSGQT
jgi:hypothetical protein